MINLPESCKVNKIIPKYKFYEQVTLSSNIKEEFINLVDKITWMYKLSPSTLNIEKTDNIEEIQVIELELKINKIPNHVIKIITKTIKYPILFMIKYQNEYCYLIKIEDNTYTTEWNEEININYNAINLEILYQNIVKLIIKEENTDKDFDTLIEIKSKEQELIKKIYILENKVKQEKQFNLKVELNQELRKLQEELNRIEEKKYE